MKTMGNGELDWSVATRAFPGEELSGDGHLVAQTATGWLLAVADGLGHGPEAATASAFFMQVLQHHAEKSPVELIQLCHNALRSTRGSAGTIVAIDRKRSLLTWVGVGNVEGVIRHAAPDAPPTEYITLRGGIVGYRLPGLQPSLIHLLDGDILVLATDGIEGDFVHGVNPQHPPGLLAGYILDRYAKPTDDALVLVARWRISSTQQEGISP
jgi:negative regulator of sigma-B (phosphoserine phosphatase)